MAALKPASFFSVPVDPEIDDAKFSVTAFQLLHYGARKKTVQTYQSKDEHHHLATVQPLALWREDEVPRALEVFVIEEPQVVDVVALIGGKSALRHEVFVWVPTVSDVDGCLTLERPQVAKPQLQVSDPAMPLLSLLDELISRGWRGVFGACGSGSCGGPLAALHGRARGGPSGPGWTSPPSLVQAALPCAGAGCPRRVPLDVSAACTSA